MSVPGWAVVKLADVTRKVGSGATPKGGKNSYHTEGTPLIRSLNIHFDRFLYDGLVYLSDAQARELDNVVVRVGDVLLNITGASIGRVNQCPPDLDGGRVNQHVCIIRPETGLDSGFLRHFLSSPQQQNVIFQIESGVTRQALTKEMILDFDLPIAPLNEQRRIVAKIEELFSDLDAGVAALERIKANLKRYRAAVLKAAVEGTLIKPSHPHFEKDNWLEIGTVLTCVEQGWSPMCERVPATDQNEWAVMKTSAVMPMQFLEDENKRLPVSLAPEPDLTVQPNDLLITRAGPRARAAVTCLVRSCRPRLIVCDKVYRMRCDPAAAVPAYLEAILNSPPVLHDLDELKTGISDSGVNLTQQRFRRLKVPLPPLQIQERIVIEVEERLSIIAVNEQQIEANLKRAARLRQSILKRAFEGRLVPQDPTEEPADKLLARIPANREAEVRTRPAGKSSPNGAARKGRRVGKGL